MNIKKFSEINQQDLSLVGGKGLSLGLLTRNGFNVPDGFVITTQVFDSYYQKDLPSSVDGEILDHFDLLKTEKVAVRSSAIGEDSKDSSWAGLFVSYLNVGREDLVQRVRDCWRSIESEKINSYSSNLAQRDKPQLAVVVQKMVQAQVSGVMFTKNPVTQKDEILIESTYGLGELLVQGQITPDSFLVNHKMEILARNIEFKDKMLSPNNYDNREIEVPEDLKNVPSLSDKNILDLAMLGKKIEQFYGYPQDIEFSIEKDQIYILQSRPITTL